MNKAATLSAVVGIMIIVVLGWSLAGVPNVFMEPPQLVSKTSLQEGHFLHASDDNDTRFDEIVKAAQRQSYKKCVEILQKHLNSCESGNLSNKSPSSSPLCPQRMEKMSKDEEKELYDAVTYCNEGCETPYDRRVNPSCRDRYPTK